MPNALTMTSLLKPGSCTSNDWRAAHAGSCRVVLHQRLGRLFPPECEIFMRYGELNPTQLLSSSFSANRIQRIQ